jgi:protocatechuate 3,4-dioxygenase, beta subunit
MRVFGHGDWLIGVCAILPTAAMAQWCPALGPEQMPAGVTSSVVLAPESEPGERMIVSGRVTESDGLTPAPGVILYAYQTNLQGRYVPARGATGLGALHGHLRGWVQTDAAGRYRITTIRPGAYPGRVEAEHIHLEVLPVNGAACEIDAVEFTDDPLMTASRARTRPGYGGPGIVTPTRDANRVWQVTRDIRLWPATRVDTLQFDTAVSIIAWKGTKLGGRGKHEGTVNIAAGELLLGGAPLVQARVTIPLASLEVTDIPVWEPVPRSRLRTHLLGDDFFSAARFPTATLVIRRATRTAPGTLRVFADLTIRDSTRALSFDAQLEPAGEASIGAIAYFRINRTLWGLTYRGSQLGNDLVDDDITFRVKLVARRRRG